MRRIVQVAEVANKAPIYTHFWGCGIAGTKSKQGLESCATVVAHLHTEVGHSLGVQLSGKRRKTAYLLGFLTFGRVSRPLRQNEKTLVSH